MVLILEKSKNISSVQNSLDRGIDSLTFSYLFTVAGKTYKVKKRELTHTESVLNLELKVVVGMLA